MFCGSWMLSHSGIGPNTTSRIPVNVEYISERFGLLVIITCGESLFAAIAILERGESLEKLCVACLSIYYALLIKLLRPAERSSRRPVSTTSAASGPSRSRWRNKRTRPAQVLRAAVAGLEARHVRQ